MFVCLFVCLFLGLLFYFWKGCLSVTFENDVYHKAPTLQGCLVDIVGVYDVIYGELYVIGAHSFSDNTRGYFASCEQRVNSPRVFAGKPSYKRLIIALHYFCLVRCFVQ